MNKNLLEIMLQKPERGSLNIISGSYIISDLLLENICIQYCKEDKNCLAFILHYLHKKSDIISFSEDASQLTIEYLKQRIEIQKINKIFIERADWQVEFNPKKLKKLATQYNIMIFISGIFKKKQWQDCTNFSDRELHLSFCEEEQQKIVEIRSIKPEEIAIYATFNQKTGKIGI